jgi:hypothetical protein
MEPHCALVADRAHCILQSHRFLHGLGHKGLKDSLSERREHAAAKTADETLHADECNAICFIRLSIEQVHPSCF